MTFLCQNINDSGIYMGFLSSILPTLCRGSLATPRLGLSGLFVRKKTGCGVCGLVHHTFYDRKIRKVRDLSCRDMRIYLEVEIRRGFCRRCQKVKQEKLEWWAEFPFYTKRFAFYIGGRCRGSTLHRISPRNWIKLEDGQGLGKAVYAGAAWSSRESGAQSDWD